VAAAAFRRLVRHLRHRHDAQNIDLMGLAGFCRNCLADWIVEAGAPLDKAAAREAIHGLPAAEWKAATRPATPEQLARMDESMKRNAARLTAADRIGAIFPQARLCQHPRARLFAPA
jgi:hypothetical protein